MSCADSKPKKIRMVKSVPSRNYLIRLVATNYYSRGAVIVTLASSVRAYEISAPLFSIPLEISS